MLLDVESMYFYTNTPIAFMFPRRTVHASIDLISGVETLHAPRCSTSTMFHTSLKKTAILMKEDNRGLGV